MESTAVKKWSDCGKPRYKRKKRSQKYDEDIKIKFKFW